MELITKMCRGCKEEKDISAFYWDKRFNIPLARCKRCCYDSNKKYKSKMSELRKQKRQQLKEEKLSKIIGEKYCCHCKKIKPLREFGNNIRSKDSFDFNCKSCANQLKQESKMRRKNNIPDQRFTIRDVDDTTRECKKCHQIKPITSFKKSKRCISGRTGLCKRCSVVGREAWNEFFVERYGANPKCQVCDKQLSWSLVDKTLRVNFDHRHNGDEAISKAPATWYRDRLCTDENIAIWESCDFGLLCIRCNQSLPTKNRKQWLQCVLDYMNERKIQN